MINFSSEIVTECEWPKNSKLVAHETMLNAINTGMKSLDGAVHDYHNVNKTEYVTANICLTSAEHLKQLNETFAGKNETTDVLSFPYGEKIDENTNSIHLGDIAISKEHCEEGADKEGHSFLHHLAILTIHGTLHLLGFDHEYSSAAKAMYSLQEQIFNKQKLDLLNGLEA